MSNLTVRQILKKLRKDNVRTDYKIMKGKIYRRDQQHLFKRWYFVANVSECVKNSDGKICDNNGEIY